jgi:hypothetical protein
MKGNTEKAKVKVIQLMCKKVWMVLLAERLAAVEAALRHVEQKKGATQNDVLVFKRWRDCQQGNVGIFSGEQG